MLEVWKDIGGYEGLYQVSNLGRVRRGGHILKKYTNYKSKYDYVKLYKLAVGIDVYVHRLVASAFIPNPHRKPCINHKDYVRNNNVVDNLEWVTYSENNFYSWKRKKELINGTI